MAAPVVLVLARAENGVIGKDGGLPWRLPGDLPRFKQITMGKPCIMGRKTWDSLPRKPLAGRTNIVVTRNPSFAADGAVAASSFEAALARAAAENPPEIMVIGGAEIFAAALPHAGKILLTVVYGTVGGDVEMADFPRQTWCETARQEAGPSHAYVTLERIKA